MISHIFLLLCKEGISIFNLMMLGITSLISGRGTRSIQSGRAFQVLGLSFQSCGVADGLTMWLDSWDTDQLEGLEVVSEGAKNSLGWEYLLKQCHFECYKNIWLYEIMISMLLVASKYGCTTEKQCTQLSFIWRREWGKIISFCNNAMINQKAVTFL